MNTESNIVAFPKSKIVREHPVLEDPMVEEMKTRGSKNYADFICDEMADKILASLHASGVDLSECEHDLVWSLVALKSGVYRSMGLNYPHHEFFDEHKDRVIQTTITTDKTTFPEENDNDTD